MTTHEARLREYYDREMAERDTRPLGKHREARVAESAALCGREGLTLGPRGRLRRGPR